MVNTCCKVCRRWSAACAWSWSWANFVLATASASLAACCCRWLAWSCWSNAVICFASSAIWVWTSAKVCLPNRWSRLASCPSTPTNFSLASCNCWFCWSTWALKAVNCVAKVVNSVWVAWYCCFSAWIASCWVARSIPWAVIACSTSVTFVSTPSSVASFVSCSTIVCSAVARLFWACFSSAWAWLNFLRAWSTLTWAVWTASSVTTFSLGLIVATCGWSKLPQTGQASPGNKSFAKRAIAFRANKSFNWAKFALASLRLCSSFCFINCVCSQVCLAASILFCASFSCSCSVCQFFSWVKARLSWISFSASCSRSGNCFWSSTWWLSFSACSCFSVVNRAWVMVTNLCCFFTCWLRVSRCSKSGTFCSKANLACRCWSINDTCWANWVATWTVRSTSCWVWANCFSIFGCAVWTCS